VTRAFVIAGLRLALLFALVFYGADAITAARTTRFELGFAWERAMPYWPPAYVVYYSVLAMPLAAGWWLRDVPSIRQWEARMALAIVVAGALFLLLPGQLGYGATSAGAWQPVADWTHVLAGRHNLLPSLHVALTLVIVLSVWSRASVAARAVLVAWTVALAASALLTHQHHVLDLLAGAALGAWAGRLDLAAAQRPGRSQRRSS
jgi:membrane-associated phospholipid phosphatase